MLILSIPGFVGSEELPANLGTAIEHQAAAIQQANEGSDAPPILMGYSSGGTFAYGMAAHLERIGTPVAAVVLLDSYLVGDTPLTGQLEGVVLELLSSPQWRGYLTETRLTAMGWYMDLLSRWSIEPINAPTLLARAQDPMISDLTGSEDWKPKWPVAHEAIDLPGNHYSMLQDQADVTAAAVEAWLGRNLHLGSR